MTSSENTRGLGLYPSDPCYDPNRPSILPYWIDDLTESACFYKSDSILGQTVTAGAYMAGQTAGAVGQGILNAVELSPMTGILLLGAVFLLLRR